MGVSLRSTLTIATGLALLPACASLFSIGTPPSGAAPARAETADPQATTDTAATPHAEADAAAPRHTTVVAVFDVEDGTERFPAKDVRQLGDYLSTRVATIPDTRVVPRDQLRTALGDAKAASYRACFDEACQLELGKAVSAEKSLAVKLLRVGSRCAMTAALFDLKTETTERAASTKTECVADALFAAADELVRQLGGPAPDREAPATTERPGRAPTPAARAQKPSVAEEPPLELRLDESQRASDASVIGTGAERAHPTDAKGGSSVIAGSRAPDRATTIAHTTELPASADHYQVRFRSRRGSRILEAPAPLAFGRDRDELDASTKRALDRLVEALLRDPQLQRQRLEIVGHAETMERGPRELSERRARAVRTYLAGHGLPLARLGLVAAGDTDPLATPPESRRVELRIPEND